MKVNEELFIMHQSGINLIHINLGLSRVIPDEMLFGGFQSVINELVMRFESNEIMELDIAGLNLISIFDNAYSVFFLMISKDMELGFVKKDLKVIQNIFHKSFHPDEIINWGGDIAMFNAFIEDIKKLKKVGDEYLIPFGEDEISIEEVTVLKEIEQQNEISISNNRIVLQKSNILGLDLSDMDLTSLPEIFGQLRFLRTLNLFSNNLASLPRSFGNLSSLEKLNLNNNRFEELPTQLGFLTNLKNFAFHSNPWKGESKEMIKNALPVILDYCRKRASINIFMSHAVVNYDHFNVKQISDYLEDQKEIYKSFYCEQDLSGNIDDFMNEIIPQCQLLLFFASYKSVFESIDCQHELELARNYKIQIIPIKGSNVNWKDLSNVGLSRELGFEFQEQDIESLLEKLYEYIIKFKRDIDLFDAEKAKIDRERLNLKLSLEKLFDTPHFNLGFEKYWEDFADLFQKLSEGAITQQKYYSSIAKIIYKKIF